MTPLLFCLVADLLHIVKMMNCFGLKRFVFCLDTIQYYANWQHALSIAHNSILINKIFSR